MSPETLSVPEMGDLVANPAAHCLDVPQQLEESCFIFIFINKYKRE